MLRFLRSDSAGTPPGSRTTAAQQWQVVDLSPVRQAIARGGVVDVSADFAAAPGARGKSKFGIAAYAFAGPIADAADLWNRHHEAAVGGAEKEEPALGNPGQWQRLTTQFAVPAETTFLMIEIRAAGAGTSGKPYVEFPGHYADAVTVRVRPAP